MSKPQLRKQRGNCGGSFRAGLPQSQVDDIGRYVMGYRVAPDCGEAFSDAKIRSCPVADANRAASLINAFSRHRNGLATIKDTFPHPSCAVIEAVDVLHNTTEEMLSRARERALNDGNK